MGLLNQIKNEAVKNNVKIQDSKSLSLEKIFNKMFFLEKDIEEETKFLKQVMTRGADTQERIGLHASALIVGEKDFCLRAQVLSLIYKQSQGEDISPSLKRIFEQGNAIHEKWQRLFIRAGYSKAKELDFTQFNEKYRISFTPDVICTINEFSKSKLVGEIKSVNTYQFQKMQRHPSAHKQLQWYMFLTGIHQGFVLSEDKNTQNFKIEYYKYDSSLVAPYIERAEQIKFYYKRVFKENKMIKRPAEATSSSCKFCENCAMKPACWNVGMGKIKIK